MPQSKRRSQQFKISFLGEVTLTNGLDWLIAIYVVSMVGMITLNLGGVRAETMMDFVQILGGLVFLHTIWVILKSRKEPFKINRTAFIFLPFVVYAGIHWQFLSPVPWVAREQFLEIIMAYIIFWVVLHNFHLRSQVWFLLIGLIGIAGICVLQSYNQYFRNPERLPMGLTLSPQYLGRATGTFGAPTSFAGLMLLVLFPMLVSACTRRLSVVVRVFSLYVGLMFLLGMILSLSRGAVLAALCVLLLFPFVVFEKIRTKIIGLIVSLLTVAFVTVGVYFTSTGFKDRVTNAIEEKGEWSRYIMWEAAWNIFQAFPVFGGGLGSYRLLFGQYRGEGQDISPLFAHNEYLHCLAELGVVGFFLLGAPVLYLMGKAYFNWRKTEDTTVIIRGKKQKRTPSTKLFLGGMLLALVAFAIHECFEFHLKLPALLFWVSIYIGILSKCVPGKLIKLQFKGIVSWILFAAGTAAAVAFPLWTLPIYEADAYSFDGVRRMKELSSNYEELKLDKEFFEKTNKILRHALELEPEDAEAWNALSRLYYKTSFIEPSRSKELGGLAKEYSANALAIVENDADYLVTHACALWLSGEMDATEEYLKRAMELEPYHAGALYIYASLLNHDEARRDEALTVIDRSIELNPGNRGAINLRRKILIP